MKNKPHCKKKNQENAHKFIFFLKSSIKSIQKTNFLIKYTPLRILSRKKSDSAEIVGKVRHKERKDVISEARSALTVYRQFLINYAENLDGFSGKCYEGINPHRQRRDNAGTRSSLARNHLDTPNMKTACMNKPSPV